MIQIIERIIPRVVRQMITLGMVSLATFLWAAAAEWAWAQTPTETARTSTKQPAHVLPYEQAEILAKASGFVSRVNVDIGDRVEKDQVLAELWIPEMEQEMLVAVATVDEAAAAVKQREAAVAAAKARLREEQAGVARYQADVDFRRSEHSRIAELVRKKSLNEGLLDEKLNQLRSGESALAAAQAAVASAEANIQVANANLSHAEARLELAEANLKKTEVLMGYAQLRAPFAGLVTLRNIDTGDFVASAAGNHPEPLFTLCTTDRLRIVADIPESQASRIEIGQPTELAVDGLPGVSFKGVVARTSGVLDSRTRTLRVEAELSAPAPLLRPGMYGLLTIALEPRLASH